MIIIINDLFAKSQKSILVQAKLFYEHLNDGKHQSRLVKKMSVNVRLIL